MSKDFPKKMIYSLSLFIYSTYLFSGVGYLFAESPSLVGWIGMFGYRSWAVLLVIGALISVIGSLIREPHVEVVGTLPLFFAALVYAASLVHTSPYGMDMLGVSASLFVLGTAGWLFLRFFVIWTGFNARLSEKE